MTGEERAHYCPECSTWWPCQGDPCDTPLVAPCPPLGSDLDWRVALDERQQPYPEWYSMAQNLYPYRGLPHPEGYPHRYWEWLVWQAFNIVRISEL
jgi:hypothetical protein